MSEASLASTLLSPFTSPRSFSEGTGFVSVVVEPCSPEDVDAVVCDVEDEVLPSLPVAVVVVPVAEVVVTLPVAEPVAVVAITLEVETIPVPVVLVVVDVPDTAFFYHAAT